MYTGPLFLYNEGNDKVRRMVMAYCRHCGTQINSATGICPQCGTTQKSDDGSVGWTVLGCCVPLVGLILWLVWREEKPNNAKAAGMGALIYVGFYVLMMLIGGCAAMLG